MSRTDLVRISAVSLAAVVLAVSTIAASKPAVTVFTAEQASAGEKAYNSQCAMCHGAELRGSNAPGLVGTDVMQNFDTVAGLYTYISTAMPPQAPGRLAEQDYLNIVAYILKANGARAGTAPLVGDPQAMKGMSLAAIAGAHGSAAPSASSALHEAPEAVPQAYTWGKTLPSVK
ncbi:MULTISPECIES: c-type cytochrome [unclassified Sphingobium]|uniref:c-type cytochrome n=1 Tax=unclassified Sphingobium TaxID=2611147 RepID=UPI0022244E28|nr:MULTISPECIES: cytochrome c [unclassified Sphingobium]MCW2380601.1 mono/diheme cytochrome c family protein [Sphingobium sp. B2D3B]MCW2399292.1 mono/diheme cytochrome c family protein [Sphingobium sp. B2D3C]